MKVFTYGTLMRGHRNHHLLEGSTFLGLAVTSDKYRMLDSGFPVLLPDDNGHQVAGEVYEVDAATMAELDHLEGKGRMYNRVRKYVRMRNGYATRLYYYVGVVPFWKERGYGHHHPINDRLQWPEGRTA